MSDSSLQDTKAKHKNRFRVDLKNYKISQVIKKGGYGIVYSVTDQENSQEYAAKVLISQDSTPVIKQMISREIGIMIRVQHPTIINFRGYSLEDFDHHDNIVILMDLAAKGSLSKILQEARSSAPCKEYTNTVRQIILVGIARGMMHLHQNRIVHGDIKPDNILIDENYHPLITDFGLSKVFELGRSTSSIHGTTAYMAPEVISKNQYNGKSDVYSFGILMFEVLTGLVPYPLFQRNKMSDFDLKSKVVHDNYRPKFTVPIKTSLQNLITQCWSKDPKNRPTFEEIYNKLAFNIENSSQNIYDEITVENNDEEENENEEDEDLNKYYLDDIDVDELLCYIDEINGHFVQEEKSLSKSSSEKVEIKKEEDNFEEQKDQLKKEFQSYIEKTRNEIIENEIKPLKSENENLKNEIKEKENQFKKQLEENDTKIRDELIKTEIDPLKNENEKLKLEMKKISDEISNKNKEINSLKSDNEKLKEKIETLEKILNENDLKDEQKGEKMKEKDEIKEKVSPIKKVEPIIIDKNIKINDFNSISLQSQQSIIFDIIADSAGNQKTQKIFEKLNEILLFFTQFNLKPDSTFFIEIPASNPKEQLSLIKDEIKEIHLLSNSIEFLYQNGILDSSELISILHQFSKVLVDIKYPLKGFKAIYNIISSVKTSKLPKMKIQVSIMNIQNENENFSKYQNVDYFIIDDSVESLNNSFFRDCSSLSQISIPKSVSSLGNYSFCGCSSLKEITISPSISSIGNSSFSGCSSLESVTIPASITMIGKEAFKGCSSLKKIKIPSSLTSIEKGLFCGCSSLKEVTIPSCVESIGEESFMGCSLLTKIVIPKSVSSMGNKAFKGCSSMSEISIPSSIETIENETFSDCSSLKQITMNPFKTKLDSSSFENCPLLSSLIIDAKITSIKQNDLDFFKQNSNAQYQRANYGMRKRNHNQVQVPNTQMQISEITLPNSLVKIEDNAFNGFVSLKKITIPSSVNSIGNQAFSSCTSLTEIEIPPSVKSIGDLCFYCCNSLAKLTIDLYSTVIPMNAFQNCGSLRHLIIDSNAKIIKMSNFQNPNVSYYGYTNFLTQTITEITLPPSATTIDDNAFTGFNLIKKIQFPNSVTSIGKQAFLSCSSLDEISIPSSVRSIGNLCFSGCNSLRQVTIDPYVTKIAPDSFQNCPNLQTLNIGSSVKAVKQFDFEQFGISTNNNAYYNGARFPNCYPSNKNSSLRTIVIPSSAKRIEENAFYSCFSVVTITIPEGVTSIGNNAFYGCVSLQNLQIPSSVTQIGSGAFFGCSSIQRLTIPSSVKSVGSNIFGGCSSLVEITIPHSISTDELGISDRVKITYIRSPVKRISYR